MTRRPGRSKWRWSPTGTLVLRLISSAPSPAGRRIRAKSGSCSTASKAPRRVTSSPVASCTCGHALPPAVRRITPRSKARPVRRGRNRWGGSGASASKLRAELVGGATLPLLAPAFAAFEDFVDGRAERAHHVALDPGLLDG